MCIVGNVAPTQCHLPVKDNINNRDNLRSKSAALTRARKLRKEGDAEIAKLKAQGSKIDAVTESMKARISELEVRCPCSTYNGRENINKTGTNGTSIIQNYEACTPWYVSVLL